MSQLDAACKCLGRPANAQAQADQAEYKRKVATREERAGRARGRHINPPAATPKESKQ